MSTGKIIGLFNRLTEHERGVILVYAMKEAKVNNFPLLDSVILVMGWRPVGKRTWEKVH